MYVSVGLCKFKCNAICLDTIVKNEYKENYEHNNHDHNQSKKSGWFFWTMIQVEHSFHRLVYHAAPSTTAASSGSQALDGTPKSHSQLHDWQLRKQGWAYSVVAHLWKGTLKVFDATLLRPPPLWMAKAGPPNEIHREIQKKKTCWCLCATESYEAPEELCFQSFSSPSEMLSIWTWEGEISPQCFQSSGAEMRRIQVGRGVA